MRISMNGSPLSTPSRNWISTSCSPATERPSATKPTSPRFKVILTDVTAQVTKLRQQGVSPEDAAQRVDLTAHAKDFPQIRAPGADPRGVRRIYQWLDER